MTDLGDFKRKVYEPEVAKLRAKIAEVERERDFEAVGCMGWAAHSRKAIKRAAAAEARVAELTQAADGYLSATATANTSPGDWSKEVAEARGRLVCVLAATDKAERVPDVGEVRYPKAAEPGEDAQATEGTVI